MDRTVAEQYALIGARLMKDELEGKLAQLLKDFPALRKLQARAAGRAVGRPRKAIATSTDETVTVAKSKTRKRKYSAATRKALSDAMKKRWAAAKKAGTNLNE